MKGGEALGATLRALGATGAAGEAVKVPAPEGFAAPLVLAVGLGDGDDAEALRRAAGVAARTLAGAGRVALALPVATAEAAEAVGLGALLGAYAFAAYRTPRHAPVAELVILTSDGHRTEVEAGARRATVIGEELNRCRDLVNLPANDLDPEAFAATVRTAARRHGLGVEVLDEKALAEQGFGGILGVGQGSARPPGSYGSPSRTPEATTSLAFVGKGITYDSGGISLKPVGANEIMKRDMSGAAAVFAAVVAAARLGLRVDLTGWLALAENMPSGTALRPGDVLRMYGGRTVEVRNTDAEGRLVLADTLVRAAEERPGAIVDVATLTAAMKLALGHRTFGVLSDHDAFRGRVLDAAARPASRPGRCRSRPSCARASTPRWPTSPTPASVGAAARWPRCSSGSSCRTGFRGRTWTSPDRPSTRARRSAIPRRAAPAPPCGPWSGWPRTRRRDWAWPHRRPRLGACTTSPSASPPVSARVPGWTWPGRSRHTASAPATTPRPWCSPPAAAGWARSCRARSTTSSPAWPVRPSRGRIVDLRVGDVDALVAGLSCGGDARCLLMPATELPEDLWERLVRREPVCLVTRLDGDEVAGTAVFGPDTIGDAGEDAQRLFGRATSGDRDRRRHGDHRAAARPQARGRRRRRDRGGPGRAAGLLGWNTQTMTDADAAATVLAELADLDNVVVISHDAEIAGRALMAVLSGGAGYIGALGSRRTQQVRAELAGRARRHRARPDPRPGRPGRRRRHPGRDRGVDRRRGPGRTVGYERRLAARQERVDPRARPVKRMLNPRSPDRIGATYS